MTQQKKSQTDRRTLLWLWGMILTGCLLVFHNYLLGNETLVFNDVGSDTRQQYLMWYHTIVNHLREGSFAAWDFNNGFGANVFLMNLTDPFLMLVYFLGTLFGPEQIAGYMVYVQILKILLAGTACYYFLSVHPTDERAKLMASFMYAFNGYLMVWGQHYQMGTFLVFLPLLLMFIEKTLKNWKNCFGVAAISGIIILCGFYQGYMSMLGCGCYVCVRVLMYEDRPWKKRWSFFILEAASMVFGVLMGSLNLLSGMAAVVGASARLDSNSSLFERILSNFSLWPREYYRSALYRFFGSNLQGSGNFFVGYGNYYEAINLFFSTLLILLLAQYVFTIHRQKKTLLQKLAQYLGIAAVAFSILIEAGSLIFNGFAYAFSRQSFLFMPLFALVSARMLHQILSERKISWLGLASASAVILVVYGKAYQNMSDVNYRTNALVLCLTGLVMAGALFRMFGRTANQTICCQVLLLALFVNVISDTSLCYKYRDTLKKDDTSYYEETYDSSVNRALTWLSAEDNSFYRVEKDFTTASGYMDSMAQNYPGVSTYNSTQNKNIVRFVEKLWSQLLTGYDRNHYDFANTIRESQMASLTGVKYLLSKNGELNLDGYERYHQIEDIYIYRNTATTSIGKFFTKTVDEVSYEEQKSQTNTWELLGEVLITEETTDYDISVQELESYRRKDLGNLLKIEKLDPEEAEWTEDGVAAKKTLVHLPLDYSAMKKWETVTMDFVLNVENGTEVEIRMDGTLPNIRYHYGGEQHYTLQIPSGTKEITIELRNPNSSFTIEKLNFYGTEEAYQMGENAVIELEAPKKDSSLSGRIETKQDGMVMLAIPYENGWSVYLNGEKQELMAGDYGFLSFEVKEGTYDLQAVFEAPFLKVGLTLTITAWVLWMIGLTMVQLNERRHRKLLTEETEK